MLAHSPPLPLIIDCLDEHENITAEDQAGIILALRQRDRIRRVRVLVSVSTLGMFVMALSGEFPILEELYLRPQTQHDLQMTLPETFHAPHLRHLLLSNFAIPIGSPLLATASARGLVTLMLAWIHPSAFFHPYDLLQRLSLMPLLETLWITSHTPNLDLNAERHASDTVMTNVTFPNLRWFVFSDTTAYLEVLLPWMTTPLLERLYIMLYRQPAYSLPSLVQFMRAKEGFRLPTATLDFQSSEVGLKLYPREGRMRPHFFLVVYTVFLDWQLACMAEIIDASVPLSSVKHLTIRYTSLLSPLSFATHSMTNRTLWRSIFRRFVNVKTLQVDFALVEDISRSLKPDDGEDPMELLPELKELSHFGTGSQSNAFQGFADSRQNAGRPVTIVRR
jgi:hypothetical protein